jgi:hypothetical protein
MKQKYLISLLGAATLLAACDKEYTGVTKVTQTFVAKQKPDSAAVVRVEAGNYATKVKVSKDTTTLALGATTFAVRTPSRLNEGGIFQNFDLSPV